MEKSADAPDVDPAYLPSAIQHINDMDRYCRTGVCRHRSLVEYFGQSYEPETCSACDICLGDAELVPESQVVAQKILSCVARVKERFGVGHVVSVLRGENLEKIRQYSHDQLTTFGLLQEHSKGVLRDWIYQLIGQQVLVQEGDEYPVLKLNAGSWEVMKGQRTVRLLQPIRREEAKASKADTVSWEGVDRELFESLRELRRVLAAERDVSAFVIFSDATLRELARARPSTLERMRRVYGVGETKLQDFGQKFLDRIIYHCREHGVTMDVRPSARQAAPMPMTGKQPNPQRDLAFQLFREGAVVEDVMHQTGRGRSTVFDYLCQFISTERPASLSPWVSDEVYQQVVQAAKQEGTERLKPIFLALGEKVSYDEIRVVVTSMACQQAN